MRKYILKIITLLKRKDVMMTGMIILFLIIMVLIDCKKYFHSLPDKETVSDSYQEVGQDVSHSSKQSPTSYKNSSKNPTEKYPEAEEQFKMYFYTVNQWNSYETIRVLLNNPEGGIYFQRLEILSSEGFSIQWNKKIQQNMNQGENIDFINYIDFVNSINLSFHDDKTFTIAYIPSDNDNRIHENNFKQTQIKNSDFVFSRSGNASNKNISYTKQIEHEKICDINLSTEQGVTISSKNTSEPYEGTLEIFCNENGFFVVNQLPLENYLYYVVPGEMPASYPLQALMAQAICARTYAYGSLEHPYYPSYYANIDDSTSTQVYHTKERNDQSTLAVDQTKGIFLAEDGKPAGIFYYSTSWGKAGDTDLWATSQMDRDLSFRKNVFTETEFKDMITSAYPEDTDYGESFYRWKYSCTNIAWKKISPVLKDLVEQGNVVCFKEKKETTLSHISDQEVIKDIHILERGSGGGVIRLEIETNLHSYLILGELSIRKILFAFDGECYKNDNSKAKGLSLLPSSYIYIERVTNKNELESFVIYGGGLGHGIGMSQNGAKNLALKGDQYDEILKYYYKDFSLSKKSTN